MKLVLFGEDVFSATVLQSLLDANFSVQLIICPIYNNNNHKGIQRIADINHIEFIREKDGENESAVTIHFIEEGIDTGDIVAQQKFEIKPTDYIADVQFKMLAIYKTLMVDALNLLQSDNFKATKQSENNISYFGPLKKRDREININATKNEVFNLIRAVSMPYEGAFYGKYTIWTSDFVDKSKEEQLMKTYPENGIFEDERNEELIIRLHDGVLISDDFEIIN